MAVPVKLAPAPAIPVVDPRTGVATMEWYDFFNGLSFGVLKNFANDTAAAAGGVPLNGLYRNGSVVQIRVT